MPGSQLKRKMQGTLGPPHNALEEFNQTATKHGQSEATMQLFKRFMWISAAIVVIAACEREAKAQYGAPSVRNNYRDATIRRPTVSPYLGLFERSGTATTPYYSFVKPRIEQEADNRRFQQQNAELRQQLNQVSVQANAQQQAGRLPTGHRTTYMYYSHYFTMPQR